MRYLSIKIFSIILALFTSCTIMDDNMDSFIREIPKPRSISAGNDVSNPDGIINDADVVRINSLLDQLENNTGVQTAVVAIDNIGEDITDLTLATAIFEAWGIGDKEKDNGLLILLINAPDYRRIKFETGYGLEGDLPDAICKRIQTTIMVPLLKEGNISEAMVKGIEGVCAVLSPGIDVDSTVTTNIATQQQMGIRKQYTILVSISIIFGFLGFLLLISWLLFRKTKNVWRNTKRAFIVLLVLSAWIIYALSDPSSYKTAALLDDVASSAIALSTIIFIFALFAIPFAWFAFNMQLTTEESIERSKKSRGSGRDRDYGGGSDYDGGSDYGGGSSGGGGASSSW